MEIKELFVNKKNYIGALDIGSQHITFLLGEISNQRLNLVGHSQVLSKGIQKAQIEVILPDELVNIVKEAKNKFDIEGVTLSGGEPSLQSGLVFFNDEIHKLGLGIIMFSGKDKSELNSKLVESVDLLIDGPFVENKIDNKRVLLGSKNKNLSFITNRYKKYEEYFNNPISIEEVTAEDNIFINGD